MFSLFTISIYFLFFNISLLSYYSICFISLLFLPTFPHYFLLYFLSLLILSTFSHYFIPLLFVIIFLSTFSYDLLPKFNKEDAKKIDYSRNILVTEIVFTKISLPNKIMLLKSKSVIITQTSFSIILFQLSKADFFNSSLRV